MSAYRTGNEQIPAVHGTPPQQSLLIAQI